MARNSEIDFLKSIMILLMVCFHLTFVSQCFPEVKKFVYTFHMPIFLIISGFLMNVNKPLGQFSATIRKLLLPYLVMESAYVVAASMLPIAEHVDNLTLSVFLNKTILHPLGPYWYLHTMVLCGVVYYASMKTIAHVNLNIKYLSQVLAIVVAVIALWGLSKTGIVSFTCAAYFFAGAFLHQTGKEFNYFFRASWIALPVFFGLCMLPQYHDKSTVVGITIVYSVMSLCMKIHSLLSTRVSKVMLWIGRNTLPILLFSPVFTILCKHIIPFLPSELPQQINGILFITISLPICICGSMCVEIIWKKIYSSL